MHCEAAKLRARAKQLFCPQLSCSSQRKVDQTFNQSAKALPSAPHHSWRCSLYAIVTKEAALAFYTLEAMSRGGVVRMKSPLTAAQAYAKTIELRRQGFTDIVAINGTTGRRITQVQRLLKDLGQ
jgi:hypothetical protein